MPLSRRALPVVLLGLVAACTKGGAPELPSQAPSMSTTPASVPPGSATPTVSPGPAKPDTSSSPSPTSPAPGTPVSDIPRDVVWRLISVDAGSGPVEVETLAVTLVFRSPGAAVTRGFEDPGFEYYDACNWLRGTLDVRGDSFRVGDAGKTMRGCYALDRDLLLWVQEVQRPFFDKSPLRTRLAKDTLVLSSPFGTMTFER